MIKGGIEYRKIAPREFDEQMESLVLRAHAEFTKLYAQYGLDFYPMDIEILRDYVRRKRTVTPFVAFDGKPVAIALAAESQVYANCIELEYVYVENEYRRKGIATNLLQFVFAELKKRFTDTYNPKRIIFNCLENNKAAKGLYAKLGMTGRPLEVWYDVTSKTGDWERWGDWGVSIKPQFLLSRLENKED